MAVEKRPPDIGKLDYEHQESNQLSHASFINMNGHLKVRSHMRKLYIEERRKAKQNIK